VTSKWLCLDCSKDLLAPGADYHSIKNELWRQIVPRSQRHGMLCHGCIQRRLGRALTPEDFYQRSEAVDSDDPLRGPMTLEDYGILDDLRVPSLTPVDLYLIEQVRSVPKKIRQVIVATLQDPSVSMPQVTDLFYLEWLEFLIETGALEVVKDAPEFLNVRIVSAKAK
jgi:hypothetical protein